MKIKAYTSFNERTNTHYFREFEIVSQLPEINEVEELNPEYLGERTTVKSINECRIDCEQGNTEVYNYKFFEIEKTFERLNDNDEWEFEEEYCDYIAIKREDLFREFLIKYRKNNNLTNRAFAEKIGVPLRTLEDWIGGKRVPDTFKQEMVELKLKESVE